MFSKLTDIKGVGNRVKERLVSHFGSEENALSALENLEFEKLTSVRGIPRQKLAEILRNVYSRKLCFEYVDLLKTGESRAIYRRIIDLLDRHFSTEYGRLMLSLYYPTKDIEEIKRRQEYVKRGKDLVSNIKDLAQLKEVLKSLGPLEEGKIPQIKDSAIVTEGREIFKRLNDQGVEPILLESMQDIEYLGEYSFIRYIQSDDDRFSGHLENLPSYVEVLEDREEKYFPERALAFFSKNRDKIIAASQILEMLDDRALEIVGILEEERDIVNRVAGRVRGLGGAGIGGERDEQLLTFSRAYENLDRVVLECLETANDRIVKMIEGGAVSIRGRDVLGILENLGMGASGGSSNFYEHLPPDISSLLMKIADEGEEECAKRLGISDTLMFSGLFTDELSYPLRVSEIKLKELESWLRREALRAEFKVQQDLAAFLSGYKDDIRRILTKMLEIDILVSLGEFSLGMNEPVICDSFCLGFRGARNIFLTRDGRTDVQPVDYVIGDCDIDPRFLASGSSKNQGGSNHKSSRFLASNGERIVVITGANSGGKTTLIETAAQVQIMAQMGLPVMAEESYVHVIDELYFFGKNSGGTGAGAFESLLKSFADISLSRRKKLILADEIEAVTEPGAAARIISGIVSWFLEDENTLLAVVTHLGSDLEVMEGTRIDGIEAVGLDEDLNLIVDRNPRLNTVAKSTPELIMERLSKKEQRDFYTYILERFRGMGDGGEGG